MRLILKSREMVRTERWIRRATLGLLLTAKQDAQASVRFFRKMLNATHTKAPRVINVDKNAAYPKAIDSLKASEMPETTERRQNKYLNNQVSRTTASLNVLSRYGIGSFNTHAFIAGL